MIWFIAVGMVAAFLVMCINSRRRYINNEDGWPIFAVAFLSFALFISIFFQEIRYGTHNFAVFKYLVMSHIPHIITFLTIYLAVGAVYTLFSWRFFVLPQVKSQLATRMSEARHKTKEEPSDAEVKEQVCIRYSYEYYIPEDEDIILPKLSYHAAYLSWLCFFWITDATYRLCGNFLRIVFYDIPKFIGTMVYNAIKAELERIARKVMR